MSGSRGFIPSGGYLEKGVTRLYLSVALGADGSVGTYTRRKGITSITQGTVGKYTVALANKYNALLDVNVSFIKAGDPGVRYVVSADAVQSAGTFQLSFYNLESAANLVYPLSAQLLLEVKVKNSNV